MPHSVTILWQQQSSASHAVFYIVCMKKWQATKVGRDHAPNGKAMQSEPRIWSPSQKHLSLDTLLDVQLNKGLTHTTRLLPSKQVHPVVYTASDTGRCTAPEKLCFICISQPRASVCGSSIAGIVGSNPAGGMDVCLLWVLCVCR
jgi:hypothetical protein